MVILSCRRDRSVRAACGRVLGVLPRSGLVKRGFDFTACAYRVITHSSVIAHTVADIFDPLGGNVLRSELRTAAIAAAGAVLMSAVLAFSSVGSTADQSAAPASPTVSSSQQAGD
jgi:hypothetical protein